MTAELVLAPALEELARAVDSLPPLGEWVELADAPVWTADDEPDVDELALAERVCRRCPARRECADYAVSAPVHGVWGGVWHGGTRNRERAALATFEVRPPGGRRLPTTSGAG